MFKAAEVNRPRPMGTPALATEPVTKGYYCEWGRWHMVYDSKDKCKCWDTHGVCHTTMNRLRKELYPNWQYGKALTKSMLKNILLHAKK